MSHDSDHKFIEAVHMTISHLYGVTVGIGTKTDTIDRMIKQQLQLARLNAKIEEQQNMKHWLVSEELNTASHSGFGQMIKNAQSVVDLRIAKLTAQKTHLTTKGGDHE